MRGGAVASCTVQGDPRVDKGPGTAEVFPDPGFRNRRDGRRQDTRALPIQRVVTTCPPQNRNIRVSTPSIMPLATPLPSAPITMPTSTPEVSLGSKSGPVSSGRLATAKRGRTPSEEQRSLYRALIRSRSTARSGSSWGLRDSVPAFMVASGCTDELSGTGVGLSVGKVEMRLSSV
jgi:hypothetical protein